MTDIVDPPISTGQAIFKIESALRGSMGEDCHVVRVSGRSDYSDSDEWPNEIIVGYEGKKYGYAISVQQVFLRDDEHEMLADQKVFDDRADY